MIFNSTSKSTLRDRNYIFMYVNPLLGLTFPYMVKHIQLLKPKFWIIKQMSIHTNEDHSNIMFQANPHINTQLD